MSNWQTWEIAGHTLEYDDDSHLYICDGVIVPSVTQLLKRRFGRKYEGVPKYILNNAARLGTMLHESIEQAELTGNAEGYILPSECSEIRDEFKGYLSMKKQYGFVVEKNELPLIIPYKGEIIAAGRMDLLLSDRDGRLGVADIKRTAKLDEQYLAYQLTLYGRGVKYCYGIDSEFFACVWLRKTERSYRMIRPRDELIDALLEEVWCETQSEIDIPYGGIGDEPDMLCGEGQG